MASVTRLYHYPIKGLSAQPLTSVPIEPGQPVPMDRVFALARPGSAVDPEAPRWAKKSQFVMLMLDEALGRIQTHLDTSTSRLTVTGGDAGRLDGSIEDPATRTALENLVLDLVPGLGTPPRLVRAQGTHFMDKPAPVISLINLATVRALEALWGESIDPLRFRANIYVDGLEPWAEFDLVGHDMTIGATEFSVYSRNGRCAATNVDPATGARDQDIPGKLRAAFGHKDLGIYLLAKSAGSIALGDALTGAGSLPAPAVPVLSEGAGESFICRGCYFIYRTESGLPSAGIAPGTPFAALPPAWRCPDCGVDQTAFSPHKPRINV